jgi:hypothetical protein
MYVSLSPFLLLVSLLPSFLLFPYLASPSPSSLPLFVTRHCVPPKNSNLANAHPTLCKTTHPPSFPSPTPSPSSSVRVGKVVWRVYADAGEEVELFCRSNPLTGKVGRETRKVGGRNRGASREPACEIEPCESHERSRIRRWTNAVGASRKAVVLYCIVSC